MSREDLLTVKHFIFLKVKELFLPGLIIAWGLLPLYFEPAKQAVLGFASVSTPDSFQAILFVWIMINLTIISGIGFLKLVVWNWLKDNWRRARRLAEYEIHFDTKRTQHLKSSVKRRRKSD